MIRLRDYDHAAVALTGARLNQNLTVADVAARIPIDRASVSRWLNGVHPPRAPRLFELAAALGYDLALVPQEDTSACSEETRSWDHFTPEQTDSYWIRCTLTGPHDEHQDDHTGLTWRTDAPSGRASTPQSAQNGPGVPEVGPGDPSGPETIPADPDMDAMIATQAWDAHERNQPDSCTCTIVGPATDCPVHHGRRARGPKPPPVGPGCICDGSGRTCPRHGAVI